MFATVFFIAVAFVLGSTSIGGYILGRKTRNDSEVKELELREVHGGLAGIVSDFR